MNLQAAVYRIVRNVYFHVKGFRAPQVGQFLEESQWWSPEKIYEFQNENLHKLIEYVYEYVPYYHRIMDERRLKPKNIQTTDDVIKFPVLTKEILRKNWEELVSTDVSSLKTSVRKTGGSTGEPLRIVNDYSNGAWENAAFERGLGFAGYRTGEPMVELFGGTLGLAPESFLKKLKAKFSGVVFLPAFEISQNTINSYPKKIIQSKAKVLRGYTSAIYLLAESMDDAKINISLQSVHPTAETLYDFEREKMKQIFNCEVFDQYGCAEVNSIAFECAFHNGLHISDENVFLEVLKNTKRVSNRKMGAMTLTTLHNYAMPLIRYQNGDMISLGRESCSCGRGLSRITKIYGRSNDLLLTKDGRLISATFLPSYCVNVYMKGVQQFQVIQETKDIIHLKMVKTPDFKESELKPLFEVFSRYLGNIEIKVEYVNSIPRTPQGKLKFVISKFGQKFLCKENET